ncbi:MAG: FMN-binding protein [Aquabacterium sp.]|uniref:FMN-binding protein n=1 Tax=Aquabacterium sp. TaxID=1872578 RepID=UPI0025BB6333|nr:FMN-binding protein [Aquabacterium sp.]MBI3382369.1 FMN-binding protein [Aquabacterium sp.]
MRFKLIDAASALPCSALAATAVVAAALPVTAYAVDYMTPQQAQQALFPQADRFEVREIRLDAAQMQAMATRYGVPARSAQWKVLEATQAGKRLGWVVIDNVVGKFELITYAVGISADGSVRQVEILSYRESHGGEVRLPAWRQQFVGKTAQSPIKVGSDIANISGATLSCTHLTEGIKRIAAVIDMARSSGQIGAGA